MHPHAWKNSCPSRVHTAAQGPLCSEQRPVGQAPVPGSARAGEGQSPHHLLPWLSKLGRGRKSHLLGGRNTSPERCTAPFSTLGPHDQGHSEAAK